MRFFTTFRMTIFWIPAFAGMTSLLFISAATVHALPDTWANWEKRLDRANEGIISRKLPGRCMGILVPGEPREDILPLFSFGYEVVTENQATTVVFLMEAPSSYPLDGLAMPGVDDIETSIGRFPVDAALRALFNNGTHAMVIDPNLFAYQIPDTLLTQLASLKYTLKKRANSLRILPIYVRFSDTNSQVKDYAPFLADTLKDVGLETNVMFVVVANLSHTGSVDKLPLYESTRLNAIRNLDVETFLDVQASTQTADIIHPHINTLTLGLLTLKWLGADHAEILSYAHSGQLLLSKDKNIATSFVVAGFASAPIIRPKLPHVDRERMLDKFGELIRSDILAMTRQACASILDPTAAKPSSLDHKEASRKWPVYVSLYDPQGNLGGQAGSHTPVGPLEESIRRFSLDAVRKAQPALNKTNFQNYVVDVSLPYGFTFVKQPEDYIPLLNGVIVRHKLKESATHPDGWRIYPDPHQLLGEICLKVGLPPWGYVTRAAELESFRIFSFNEKEPFQDLGATTRKKKKKKGADDEFSIDSIGGDGGGGGGGSPFGF